MTTGFLTSFATHPMALNKGTLIEEVTGIRYRWDLKDLADKTLTRKRLKELVKTRTKVSFEISKGEAVNVKF